LLTQEEAMTTTEPRRVIGYVRRSTDKQSMTPEVQRAQLAAQADVMGWALELREETGSAKALDRRPVLLAALADLKAGRADVLLVAKMDRLSRDVADGAALLKQASREGWQLVALDVPETATIMGEAQAHLALLFGHMERRRIAQRTREAMAKLSDEKRDRMRRSPGRPRVIPPEAVARARELHATGLNPRQVAEQLNADGVPNHVDPERCGKWWPETVRRLVTREALSA
jgi:DNA invertase Pin-like site-specific DNA recombinase